MIPNTRRLHVTLNFGRFNAELETTHATVRRNVDLNIILKVYFRQGTGHVTDYAGDSFLAHPWPADAWARFKRQIIVDSTQFWSGKFWLRPYHNESDLVFTASSDPRHAQTLDRWIHEHATHLPYDGQFYRSNVYCLFKMQEVDTPEHAHLTIRGDYFGAGYTDAYQNGILPDFTGVFQSGILNDIDFPSRHSHTRPHQRQYLHEIGHAIGLRHIGYEHHVPACAEVGGADQAAC
jgi:hypothetical protein